MHTHGSPSDPSSSKRAGRLMLRRISVTVCCTGCLRRAAWGCGVLSRRSSLSLTRMGSNASQGKSSSSPSASSHFDYRRADAPATCRNFMLHAQHTAVCTGCWRQSTLTVVSVRRHA